jgi:hypothetical protein
MLVLGQHGGTSREGAGCQEEDAAETRVAHAEDAVVGLEGVDSVKAVGEEERDSPGGLVQVFRDLAVCQD